MSMSFSVKQTNTVIGRRQIDCSLANNVFLPWSKPTQNVPSYFRTSKKCIIEKKS